MSVIRYKYKVWCYFIAAVFYTVLSDKHNFECRMICKKSYIFEEGSILVSCKIVVFGQVTQKFNFVLGLKSLMNLVSATIPIE